MADLRIADAPEIALENITGNEKVPTGGYGNSAVTINNLGQFAKTALSLATESYVSNAVGQKEDKITLTGVDLTPISTYSDIPQTNNNVLNTVHQDLLNRMEWIKDNATVITDHQALTNRNTFNTHPSTSISHNGTSNVSIEIEELKNDVLTINTTTVPELQNDIIGKQDVIVNDNNLSASSVFSNVPSTNNSALNKSLQSLVNRDKFISDSIKTGLPQRFDQSFSTEIGGYPLNARIMLSNGDIVRSTVANNTTDPNVDMTGWAGDGNALAIIKDDKNIVDLEIDKALYRPYERVNFSCYPSGNFGELIVEYWNGNTKIDETSLSVKASGKTTWQWYLPGDDSKGYLVKVKYINRHGESSVQEIAINVDNNWMKTPIYGFLSDFSTNLTATELEKRLEKLKRYHINGLQYYDWFDRHHIPLNTDDKLGVCSQYWTDLAKRNISLETIRKQIEIANKFNMKSMLYELIYGAATNQLVDGLTADMFLYTDNSKISPDTVLRTVLTPWAKNDLYIMNPLNESWQDYFVAKLSLIYNYLKFDGWHVDQLGKLSDQSYNSAGGHIDWGTYGEGFGYLLKKAKAARPDKALVMNAVSNYAQDKIANSGVVEFTYTENWGEAVSYNDIRDVIDYNRSFGKETVIAGYMNYEFAKRNKGGTFNTPSVLLMDAVCFSNGASHIELGEHMLCNEYFPNNHLNMTSNLENYLVKFYDFFVAYKEFLRGTKHVDILISSNATTLNGLYEANKLNTVSKENGSHLIINLVNLVGVTTTDWRDIDATKTEPTTLTDINLSIQYSGRKIWYASPDMQEMTPVVLSERAQSSHNITIPKIKYWGLLVIEK